MEVRIVDFPETRVAVAEHHGPPQLEYETSKKLIQWRQENGVSPNDNKTYGVHYTDPYSVLPADHRVDFCVTYDRPIPPNAQGIVSKTIPACRCATARHVGSRQRNHAAEYLLSEWLPSSGEVPGNYPMFFHYINVGPLVTESEMITDVYLPLKPFR